MQEAGPSLRLLKLTNARVVPRNLTPERRLKKRLMNWRESTPCRIAHFLDAVSSDYGPVPLRVTYPKILRTTTGKARNVKKTLTEVMVLH
ncbi:hypothetical protein KIN20_036737 [Parelaphostrongylus tenuis]|uniref:Uncharacterized protein n=1 Tax=Parelaphostrongylus tenuis TaxID=148309 RepID=A0AAD5RDT9_PARTN|nr:hypothetical protein KIN20_036737 [Parelaphostrongylus tenuis]